MPGELHIHIDAPQSEDPEDEDAPPAPAGAERGVTIIGGDEGEGGFGEVITTRRPDDNRKKIKRTPRGNGDVIDYTVKEK